MTRKEARDLSFKLLYQMEIQKETPSNILEIYYLENELDQKVKEYVEDVVFGVYKNKEKIDESISSSLEGWKIERISKVSLSAIRVSIYEILFRDDIPNSVSINEAVSLAKVYEGTESANFVNGILASLLKKKEIQ